MLAIPERFPAAQGDLGAAALSRLARLMLGCRLAFDGRLDAALLGRAVRLLLDAEPVLGCMAMREKLTSGEWERCADLDGAKTFAVIETGDTEEAGLAFYAEDLEPSGPRLAVRLLRTPDHDELIIKFDHLVGDGFSAKQITYMLAETYTRLCSDPTCVPTPNLAPRPCYKDVWAAMTSEQREAASIGKARFAPARWKMPLTAGEGEGMFERRLELSPERLRAVKEYGRSRGATVNDMLLTAMLRSLATMFPPEGVPFSASVTVDGRRPADRHEFHRPCNLSLVGFVEVPSSGCDTFDRTLAAVGAAIRPQKDRYWSIKEACSAGSNYRLTRGMMSLAGWMLRGMKTSQPVSMNIGVLDEVQLAFGDKTPVAAHVLGSSPLGTGFGFTTSTYREALTVWCGHDRALLDPALVERALAGIDEQLPKAEVRSPGLVS